MCPEARKSKARSGSGATCVGATLSGCPLEDVSRQMAIQMQEGGHGGLPSLFYTSLSCLGLFALHVSACTRGVRLPLWRLPAEPPNQVARTRSSELTALSSSREDPSRLGSNVRAVPFAAEHTCWKPEKRKTHLGTCREAHDGQAIRLAEIVPGCVEQRGDCPEWHCPNRGWRGAWAGVSEAVVQFPSWVKILLCAVTSLSWFWPSSADIFQALLGLLCESKPGRAFAWPA